jgi:hypothetical protein
MEQQMYHPEMLRLMAEQRVDDLRRTAERQRRRRSIRPEPWLRRSLKVQRWQMRRRRRIPASAGT